jgi:hypothetical protein
MLGLPRLPRPTVADRGAVALVAVLSTFIVLGAAGSATWLRHTADDMAAEVFEGAAHPARQVQVFYNEVGDEQVPADAGVTLEQSLAPSLRAVLGPPRHAVTTTEAILEALPKQPRYSPSYLSVVGIPDARSMVEMVQGSFPRPGFSTEVLPAELASTYDGPREVAVVEVALQRRAAEALQTPVGTYLDLVPLRYRGGRTDERTLLRVSGVYEAAVPYPSPLDDVDNVRRPAISTLPEFTLVRAAGLAADDETVLQAAWMTEPEIRWTFDPDRTPTAEQAEAVVTDARRLAVQAWPPVVTSVASTASTGLGELGSSYVAERDASNTSAALMLAALGAAALALLLAAAALLEARRREVNDVLGARGASTLRGCWRGSPRSARATSSLRRSPPSPARSCSRRHRRRPGASFPSGYACPHATPSRSSWSSWRWGSRCSCRAEVVWRGPTPCCSCSPRWSVWPQQWWSCAGCACS